MLQDQCVTNIFLLVSFIISNGTGEPALQWLPKFNLQNFKVEVYNLQNFKVEVSVNIIHF